MLALATIAMLIRIYLKQIKLPKNDLALYMIILPIVAAAHVVIFSIVLIIDHLDGVINYPIIYNIWSLFLITEILVTKLWLSILGWRKINKGESK
jgi:hypothetical protein